MLRHIKNTNPIIHPLGKLEMLFVIPQLKPVTNLMCFQMIIYLILNILTQSEASKRFINFVLSDTNISFSYTWRRVIKDLLQDGYIFKRSEEHTSELQSRGHLVCRLLLEKKKRPPPDHAGRALRRQTENRQ